MELGQGATRAWAERTEIVIEDDVPYCRDRETGVKIAMHGVPLSCGDAEQRHTTHTDVWDNPSLALDEDEILGQLPVLDTDTLLGRGDFDLPRLVVAD
jgi:hypothetical protein